MFLVGHADEERLHVLVGQFSQLRLEREDLVGGEEALQRRPQRIVARVHRRRSGDALLVPRVWGPIQ